MKILMVNKFIYPRAGAETYMLYVARCLQADGYQVALFGMEHPQNAENGLVQYTCPRIEFGSGQSRGEQLKQIGKAAGQSLQGTVRKALDLAIRDFQPDLIHAHNVYNQLPPSLFHGLPENLPVMMTAHDYKPVCPNYSLFTEDEVCTRCLDGSAWPCIRHRCCQGRLSASALAALSATVQKMKGTYHRDYRYYVAPSGFMRDRLVQGGLPADRIRVIHNFARVPEVATAPGSGLLYAGRLCREKGVDLIFDALLGLGEDAPALTLAGEGPLEAELKSRAEAAGLKNLRWLGRISPDDVVRELEACAVSIIPSRWHENCSMSIMETLAHGRPCMVSDSGGNPELVEPGKTGWVFPRDQSEGLMACLKELLAHPENLGEMGQAARASAEKRFSESVHMQQLYEVYEELVSTQVHG